MLCPGSALGALTLAPWLNTLVFRPIVAQYVSCPLGAHRFLYRWFLSCLGFCITSARPLSQVAHLYTVLGRGNRITTALRRAFPLAATKTYSSLCLHPAQLFLYTLAVRRSLTHVTTLWRSSFAERGAQVDTCVGRRGEWRWS